MADDTDERSAAIRLSQAAVLPRLSPTEREGLVESIRQHGVKYPVLTDLAGIVIDGYNRREIAAELGIECPTMALDVTPEEAARLSISLNVNRRHLNRDYHDRLVVELRQLGKTYKEIGQAVGVSPQTAMRVAKKASSNSNGISDLPEKVASKRGQNRPASYAQRKRAPEVPEVPSSPLVASAAPSLQRDVNVLLDELCALDPKEAEPVTTPERYQAFRLWLVSYSATHATRTRSEPPLPESLPLRRAPGHPSFFKEAQGGRSSS
jgi:hypothetical protein